MSARKSPARAGVEQLDLPFAPAPKATRSNGAEPLAVRIPDAVRMTGIGRSKLYELIASGELETVKIGRCTLVPMVSLRQLLCRPQVPSPCSEGA
jgi:excisionase family DNA binding protein